MAPIFSSDSIYVFGGANKTDNLNSVQIIDTSKKTFEKCLGLKKTGLRLVNMKVS